MIRPMTILRSTPEDNGVILRSMEQVAAEVAKEEMIEVVAAPIIEEIVKNVIEENEEVVEKRRGRPAKTE
jgi:hypothetical protein